MDTFKSAAPFVRLASERSITVLMEPSERERLQMTLLFLGFLWLLFLMLVGIVAALVVWHRRSGRAAPSSRRQGRPAPSKPVLPSIPPATQSKDGVLDTPVLGGKRDAWVRAMGNPNKGASGEFFAPDTAVIWARDATGTDRVHHIELRLRSAVTVAEAREQAKRFHPPDARLTRTYLAPAGQMVEVFQSDLLARALAGVTRPAVGSLPAASIFGDEPPSTYTQIAECGSPTTNRVVIGVGNNL